MWVQGRASKASIHGQYRDKLGNLTLSGDRVNPAMGNGPFHEKRADYSKSPILMNRRIADADAWSETEIEGRSEDLANRIPARWPWDDPAAAARPNRRLSQAAEYRWKLADGAEHVDVGTSQFTLNVTAALLDLDPENVKRLSGSAVTADIHLASRYPAGQKAGAITMLAIPRYPRLGDECLQEPGERGAALPQVRRAVRNDASCAVEERARAPRALLNSIPENWKAARGKPSEPRPKPAHTHRATQRQGRHNRHHGRSGRDPARDRIRRVRGSRCSQTLDRRGQQADRRRDE